MRILRAELRSENPDNPALPYKGEYGGRADEARSLAVAAAYERGETWHHAGRDYTITRITYVEVDDDAPPA